MIEIHGAGFQNKGAQLMLLTTLERIKNHSPDGKCCMEARWDSPYSDRASYGLYTCFPHAPIDVNSFTKRAVIQIARRLIGVLPAGRMLHYGLVRPDKVDALIDISGYAFGDRRDLSASRRFLIKAKDYRRRGKPVVMLPQMFGPFGSEPHARTFREILENVTLVYARDRMSFDQLMSMSPDDPRIKLAPDITIFFGDGDPTDFQLEQRRYACIVPNIRMLDQGHGEWGESYVDLMIKAGRCIIEKGLAVDVLIHETAGADADLADKIACALNSERGRVLAHPDPIHLKRHIGSSRFIVASRFHSVVGALSQGVPAIILGWAHKYDMLAEDFDATELVFRADDDHERLRELVHSLVEEAEWRKWHARLVNAKNQMIDQNEQMWKEVWNALESPVGRNVEVTARVKDMVREVRG